MTIARIRLRGGTTAEWAAANPVLAMDEPGWDQTLKRLKVGDGVSHWADLEWTSSGEASTPTSVDWTDVTGKPTTFAPTSHSHTTSDITGLATAINNAVTTGDATTLAQAKAYADALNVDMSALVALAEESDDIADLTQAVADLAAAPPDVTQAELDAEALARYNAVTWLDGRVSVVEARPVPEVSQAELDTETAARNTALAAIRNLSDAALAGALGAAYTPLVTSFKAQPVYVYGDSFAASDYSNTGPSTRFTALLAARLGLGTVTNYASPGTWMQDNASRANGVSQTLPAGTLNPIILHSVLNDVISASPTATKRLNGFQHALRAFLLLARASSRVESSDASFVYSGTWGTNNIGDTSGGSIKQTQSNGSCTITTPACTDFSVGLFGVDPAGGAGGGATGSCTIAVDGGAPVTVDLTNACGTSGSGDAARVWTPVQVPFFGLANTTHTVVVTDTSTGGKSTYLDNLLVLRKANKSPKLVVVKGEYCTSVGYTAYSASPTPTDATVDTYNALIDAVLTTLDSSANITVVDPNLAGWTPATMTGSQASSFTAIHPNDAGERLIADAIIAALVIATANVKNRANHTGVEPVAALGTGTPAAGKYVDGGSGAWTALPSPTVARWTTPITADPWVIPAGAKVLTKRVQGAAGGGGSGRRGAAGTVRTGGGGGGPGGYTEMEVLVADLGGPGTTLYITVGTGGAGGFARTVDDTDGAIGAGGTASMVATTNLAVPGRHDVGLAFAGGGNPGLAGNASGAAAGGSGGAGKFPGSSGAASTATGGGSGTSAANSTAGTGGGAGGGLPTTNGSTNGGAGGVSQAKANAGNASGGVAPSGAGNAGPASPTLFAGGSGSGGASSNGTAAAGVGGAGGIGSGGGGGGAAPNGQNSGAGGKGGDGYVEIIVTY